MSFPKTFGKSYTGSKKFPQHRLILTYWEKRALNYDVSDIFQISVGRVPCYRDFQTTYSSSSELYKKTLALEELLGLLPGKEREEFRRNIMRPVIPMERTS